MPTYNLKCQCGERLILHSPRRMTAGMLFYQARKAGWIRKDDRWYCGEDCVAAAARDVTPETRMIER